MTAAGRRADLQAALVTSPRPCNQSAQRRAAARIEDYLFIGGHGIPLRAAAQRLGVTERTISRYRAVLRAINGSLT